VSRWLSSWRRHASQPYCDCYCQWTAVVSTADRRFRRCKTNNSPHVTRCVDNKRNYNMAEMLQQSSNSRQNIADLVSSSDWKSTSDWTAGDDGTGMKGSSSSSIGCETPICSTCSPCLPGSGQTLLMSDRKRRNVTPTGNHCLFRSFWNQYLAAIRRNISLLCECSKWRKKHVLKIAVFQLQQW